MLITAGGERRPRPRVDDVRLTVYRVDEVSKMNEREFASQACTHDCILISNRLGDGDLFMKSLRDALNNNLGGAGARMILREIQETTTDPQINQGQLWANLAKTLGAGSTQIRDATMTRLHQALDEANK
jgi:hypothetical protein